MGYIYGILTKNTGSSFSNSLAFFEWSSLLTFGLFSRHTFGRHSQSMFLFFVNLIMLCKPHCSCMVLFFFYKNPFIDRNIHLLCMSALLSVVYFRMGLTTVLYNFTLFSMLIYLFFPQSKDITAGANRQSKHTYILCYWHNYNYISFDLCLYA